MRKYLKHFFNCITSCVYVRISSIASITRSNLVFNTSITDRSDRIVEWTIARAREWRTWKRRLETFYIDDCLSLCLCVYVCERVVKMGNIAVYWVFTSDNMENDWSTCVKDAFCSRVRCTALFMDFSSSYFTNEWRQIERERNFYPSNCNFSHFQYFGFGLSLFPNSLFTLSMSDFSFSFTYQHIPWIQMSF